jgi:hypothetical protein
MGTCYDPVGECIYCRSRAPKLGKEHIVAYGLGGDWILPDASCEVCAAATSRIERLFLQGMIGDFRHAVGMRTRRPKNRPSHLPVEIGFEDGREETIFVPRRDLPAAFTLPILPPARALRGEPDDDSAVMDSGFWTWHRPEKANMLAESTGGSAIGVWSCNPSTFSQMLGKIGHSYATAILGIEDFAPLALDLALGRTDHINYLVGGEFDAPIEPTENLHELRVRINEESGVVLVVVRLFAMLGSPTYHVVVGLREGGKLTKLVERATGGAGVSQLDSFMRKAGEDGA